MKKIYLLAFCFITLGVFSQSNPVAVPDTAEAILQHTISIYPLLNDYDPDGDEIYIKGLDNPRHGDNWQEDSTVFYISEYYTGQDSMRYYVKEVNGPNFSERTYIYVNVLENPEIPYAVNDTFTIRRLEPTVLDILINDGDPDGDDIKINEVWLYTNMLNFEYSVDSSLITLSTKHIDDDNRTVYYTAIEKYTNDQYFSNKAGIYLNIIDNPELPEVVDDYYEITGGISFQMDVTSNDINPLNEPIEFLDFSSNNHGTISNNGTLINYTPDTSFHGDDFFLYSIRYVNKPWLYSEKDTVHLYVNKNPDCPVGVPDYGSGMSFTPITVDVMANDYDPNGDAIEIMDVITPSWASSAIIEEDKIIYTSNAYTIGRDSMQYRVRQENDPNYYSDWTTVFFDIEYNPLFPLTIKDFAKTKGGVPVTIDVLENDIMPDTGDYTITTFQPFALKGKATLEDNKLVYTPYMNSSGIDSLGYALRNDYFPFYYASGIVYIELEVNNAYDSLTINNINAGFHSSGFQFSSGDEILGQGIAGFDCHFEVPKYSGRHTFFTHSLWLGGLDENDSLHLAGERFKQRGTDFQPGPVSNEYDSAFKYNWYGLWMLYKEEVEYHRNNWWKEGYEPIRNIAEWPGNGNVANGQAEQLGPYFDTDGNGYYDPMQGDYPLIRGDQCVYFIYNDDFEHTETAGERIVLEIHGMGYAYDTPEDSILNNTILVHYDLINRSENTYHDFYFGIFADMDLGYAWDDYIASYVKGSSFYVYNAEDMDGDGEPGTYGPNAPAQSVTILAGPFMDPDEEDNPDGGCDFSVTGNNFGNGTIDDERFGLTRFTYFYNTSGPQGDPMIADEYYNYLTGYWRDNIPVVFGGNGYHPQWEQWSQSRFMFPGDSDPLNWGTECELPIGGYNQNGLWWTEETTGNNPNDKRGMGSCGPFTFHPGQVQEVEVAYIYANSYHGADSSRNLLISYIDELRQRVSNGEVITPNEELEVSAFPTQQSSIKIFPNPARERIYIQIRDIKEADFRIVSSLGNTVMNGQISGESSEINVSGLEPGLYIISVITETGIQTKKLIKY